MRALACTLALAASLLAGCATGPTHPSLRPPAGEVATALPPLLPVRRFVADLDATGAYQISPDGRQLLWSGRVGLGPGLFVQDLATGRTRSFKVRALARWARDSRHVLLHLDMNGDENTHLVQMDTAAEAPVLKDLTPFPGAKSHLHGLLDDSPDLLVESNRRNPQVFDLYRYRQDTGELQLLAQNPGDVALWLTDGQGRVRGRAAQRDGQWSFQTPRDDAHDGTGAWQERFRVDVMETVRPLTLSADGRFIWALSDRGRDKQALVRLFLDGREEVVHADPDVDISEVIVSRQTRQPLAFATDLGLQRWQFLDPGLGALVQPLTLDRPSRLAFLAMSDDERLVVASITQRDSGRHVLIDRGTGTVRTLAEHSRSRLNAISPLAETRPVQFRSTDGLTLHGYLTLPEPRSSGPLPTVLLVHGGPFARDWHLGGQPMLEFLANRGYAVLQVNYRGSTGYGRAFRDAAQGEFAGRMHQDLIDGLDALIAQGIVDPARVAIVGSSYGGYASLVGMTFTPNRFACGISVVGMSDLSRLLEQAPAYWASSRPLWQRFIGDASDPVQREQQLQRSPITRATDAQGPILLLHGAHDPRVKLEQSQRMAQALRAAGKPVELHVFERAGHGLHRWQDRLREFRLTEDFLAGCLGGRSGGFDLFEIGAWVL